MPENEDILRKWEANSHNWAKAVREGRIVSRRSGTDAAILNEIIEINPTRLLDVGCGEGWLVRSLQKKLQCEFVGTDGSRRLVDYAKRADARNMYKTLSYDDIAKGGLKEHGRFDVIVYNFSLFGDKIDDVISATVTQLSDRGILIIQTIHPWTVQGREKYEEGWHMESFSGIDGRGWQPVPFFLRTLESWSQLMSRSGLSIQRIREPIDPNSGWPLSLIFCCQKLKSD